MRYLLLILVPTLCQAGVFDKTVKALSSGWAAVTGGAVGIGLVLFLVANIRKLAKELVEAVEYTKSVAKKFKNAPEIKQLLREWDDVLEQAAKIAARVGARSLAKRMRDLID